MILIKENAFNFDENFLVVKEYIDFFYELLRRIILYQCQVSRINSAANTFF